MTKDSKEITPVEDELEQGFEAEDFDQTSFADTLPYRNQGSRKFQVKKTEEEVAAEKKAQKKQKIIIASVGGGVLLLVLILVGIAMMQNAPIVPDDVKPLAPAQPVDDGFIRKMNDAKVILKEADPSISEYQIPPVSFELRLDPAER